jgi:hypothetical protein
LRDPVVLREIANETRANLRQPRAAAPDHRARIAQLQIEIGNLADAIASGVLRASPTLAGKLASAGRQRWLGALSRKKSRGNSDS